MASGNVDPQHVQNLLGQLSEMTKSLDKENSETERVAALKTAQELVRALEKPREAAIKMGFSVCSSIFRMTLPTSDYAIPANPDTMREDWY